MSPFLRSLAIIITTYYIPGLVVFRICGGRGDQENRLPGSSMPLASSLLLRHVDDLDSVAQSRQESLGLTGVGVALMAGHSCLFQQKY